MEISTFNSSFGQSDEAIWFANPDIGIYYNDQDGTISSQTTNHGIGRFNESSAIIKDDFGQLLFYTDGVRVWDKNHDLMMGGEDLGGHISTSQGVLVVQFAGEEEIYHVYLLGDVSGQGHLNHAVINMGMQGGLGAVLSIETLISDGLTELMVGYPHPCGGIWLLLHQRDNDVFAAMWIDKGQVKEVVQSQTGAIHTDGNLQGINNRHYGKMKLSIDGEKLVLVSSGLFELFKFDPQSGYISNPVELINSLTSNYTYLYSFEISASGELLYLHRSRFEASLSRDLVVIEQFSLLHHDYDSIWASNIEIGSLPNAIYSSNVTDFHKLKDGRILIVNRPYYSALNLIEFPERQGNNCGFVHEYLPVGTEFRSSSAPAQFIQAKKSPVLELPADTTICKSVTLHIDLSDSTDWAMTWENGSNQPVRSIFKSGTYTLEAIDSAGCRIRDTLVLSVAESSGHLIDTCLIQGQTINLSKQTIQSEGIFFDSLQTDFCIQIDTYLVNYISSTPDTLYASIDPGGSYEWKGNLYTNPGIYSLTPDSMVPCSSTQYLRLLLKQRDIYIPNAITPNGDNINDSFEIFSRDHIRIRSIRIFNRWGGVAYESSTEFNWIPQVGETGLFTFVAELNNTITGEVFVEQGEVHVIP